MTESHSQSASVWLALFVAVIMWSSYLFFMSNALLLLLIPILAMQRARIRPQLFILVAFVLYCLVNLSIHLSQFDATRHLSSPAVLLVVVMALLAPAIPNGAFKWFIALTCAEVLIGAYEFSIGQVALFDAQLHASEQEMSLDSDLLYDLRTFGLAANSSSLAEKVFISFIALRMFWREVPLRYLAYAMLLLGFFVTFNRTAIAAALVFELLYVVSKPMNWQRLLVLAGAALGVVALFATGAYEALFLQFTRGSGSELTNSELSRLYYWQQALEAISQNPLLGNGSLTFRVDDLATTNMQHAHNSYLMLVATHGSIGALLMLLFIVTSLRKDNWRAVSAIAVFAATQYFVFWNLSVPDLTLLWLLGRPAPLRLAQAGSEPGTAPEQPVEHSQAPA